MTYDVNVTEPAHLEIEAAFEWLRERTEQYSVEWFNGITEAIASLSSFPTRCPIAPEGRHFREKIYQFLCGKRPHIYRILFVIHANKVYVIHVRHGARSALGPNEV